MKNLILTLIIWIVAFTAITISASLTYTWYKNRGPEIKISFKNVAGIVPNQSKIMYRGAQIGRVDSTSLNENSDNVFVHARLTRQAAKLIGKDSKFWIVQPEFSLEKISNLHAIATGDYIEVQPVKGLPAIYFIGLEKPPLDQKLALGLKLQLKIRNLAGISTDSPILYRGFQIGEVWDIGLSEDKRDALITAYVYNHYAHLIRKTSSFSNVSGFHADIHLFGSSKFGMDSLRTLFKGGVNVSTPNLNAEQAKNDDEFRVTSAEDFLSGQNS